MYDSPNPKNLNSTAPEVKTTSRMQSLVFALRMACSDLEHESFRSFNYKNIITGECPPSVESIKAGGSDDIKSPGWLGELDAILFRMANATASINATNNNLEDAIGN